MTRHCTGATSSISSLSSASERSAPPQSGQVQLPASGSILHSSRGRWAGKARTGAARSERSRSGLRASATSASPSSSFESQLELRDLKGQLLRRLAEGHPPELGELEPQRLDERVADRQSCLQLGDPGILVEGRDGCVRHRDRVAYRAFRCEENPANLTLLSCQEWRCRSLRVTPIDAFKEHRKLR